MRVKTSRFGAVSSKRCYRGQQIFSMIAEVFSEPRRAGTRVGEWFRRIDHPGKQVRERIRGEVRGWMCVVRKAHAAGKINLH